MGITVFYFAEVVVLLTLQLRTDVIGSANGAEQQLRQPD